MIHEKQLMYYHRITKAQDGLIKNTAMDKNTPWNKHIQTIIHKYNLDHFTINNLSKNQMKHRVKRSKSKKINKAHVEKILTQGNKKKLHDLITLKTPENMEQIPTYMNTLIRRNECASIFAARGRMIQKHTTYNKWMPTLQRTYQQYQLQHNNGGRQ